MGNAPYVYDHTGSGEATSRSAAWPSTQRPEAAGVEWPLGIDILASPDGKAYHHAGELVALDQKLNGPWPTGYAIRRLVTHELQTHGRYVQFVVIPRGPYAFCDEVEVFRGPSHLMSQNPGPQITNVKELFRARKLSLAVRRRYEADIASLETAIRAGRLPPDTRSRLLHRLSEVGVGLQRAAAQAPAGCLPGGPAPRQGP